MKATDDVAPPSPSTDAPPRPATFRDGVRAGVPFALAGFLLALSFGVVAQQAGFSAVEAILMSLLVYAGSAQFTAVAILAAGGGAGAAISAATLMNSRFLAMGAALGPSLPGGPLKRAAQGQTVVDASWALAARGDGTFDRWMLFGSSAMQFFTWQTGTIVGALSADLIGDPERLGLDALFPAFFLALLMAEAKHQPGAGGGGARRPDRAGAGADHAGRGAGAGGRGRRAGRPHTVRAGRRGAGRRREHGRDRDRAACAITTAVVKAIGPIALGGRDLPDWFSSVVVLLAPALLAALVATQALADGTELAVGAETAGVAAGGPPLLAHRVDHRLRPDRGGRDRRPARAHLAARPWRSRRRSSQSGSIRSTRASCPRCPATQR